MCMGDRHLVLSRCCDCLAGGVVLRDEVDDLLPHELGACDDLVELVDLVGLDLEVLSLGQQVLQQVDSRLATPQHV